MHHFTQRLYFPYLFEEEGVELAKIPGMGRVNASQLLWIDSGVDVDEVQTETIKSEPDFCWWKNPFTKSDQYGY